MFYSLSRNKTLDILLYVILFLVFALPACLRYGIGTDYLLIYEPAIQSVFAGDIPVDKEWSFVFIAKLVNAFSEESHWVFVIYAAITYFVSLLAMQKKWMWCAAPAFLMHFYPFTLSGIRQAAAMSFLMLALRFVVSNRVSWCFISIVIATFFHFSSALMVVFLCVAKCVANVNFKVLLVSCAIASLCVILIDFSPMFGALVETTEYSKYLNDSIHGGAAKMSSGLGLLLPALMFYGLAFLLLQDESACVRLLGSLGLISCFIYAASVHMEIVRRLCIISDVGLPFAMAMIFERHRDRIGVTVFFSAFILLFAMYCKEIIDNANYGIVPYVSIFEEGVF